ncbi:MAG: hypothetical protein RIT44_501 [Pseudomonadota bacterium]|jgi:uncharacterized membrane protein YedE/YeeE
MNLASLIETWGDSNVLLMAGALVGFIFGFAAQRTRFCARAAVIECCEGQAGDRFSVWWLAFGACLVGVQVLVLAGWLKPADARYIAPVGSISGAVLGGLFFGAGMILTRGCASRLLILSANGNLRALLSGLVFAVIVQATIAGWLAPIRLGMAAWWTVDGGPSRDLLQITGIGPTGGLVLALLAMVTGFYFFFKTHPRRWALALGSIVAGLSIALGWGLTQAIASQSFEAVQIQSLSFSSGSAEMLMRALSSSTSPSLGFDAGLLPATFLGSLLGALVGGDFKFEGFKTENKLGHYLLGAVLMGFGAVLAGGCTVGAGMTGGSLFSLTAWLTLIAIWLGAGMAWRINRHMGWPI